jgi:hypothetical protein
MDVAEVSVWCLNSVDKTIWQWKYGATEEEGSWEKIGWSAKFIFCNE